MEEKFYSQVNRSSDVSLTRVRKFATRKYAFCLNLLQKIKYKKKYHHSTKQFDKLSHTTNYLTKKL